MMVTTLWSVSISIVPTISLWSQPSRKDYNLLTIILGMNNFWAALTMKIISLGIIFLSLVLSFVPLFTSLPY